MLSKTKVKPKTQFDNKLLLALTYWEGDQEAALRLAEFLADLEPKHSVHADLLLAHRFDCPPPPHALVAKVSRKFNTFVHRSVKCRTGWPAGCNGTWQSTMGWTLRSIQTRQCPPYKAMFFFEADGGPCVRNWIQELSREWDRVNSARRVFQAGPLIPGQRPHINANSLLSCDPMFLKWLTSQNVAHAPGWDYWLAPKIEKWGWANVGRIRSYYSTPHFPPAAYMRMLEEKLIWVHGDKSGCLIDYGREHLMP